MNKDYQAKKFGENVRRLRKENGLSQEKLAEVCNLHRTYIGAVERGERNICLKNIIQIAAAFGIKPAELLEGVSK
tara:strand:+ start:106 stop:330 length:225 start_codon:yes stop_codon:yes gene_type:complete